MDYRFVELNRERLERALRMRRSDFDLKVVDNLAARRRKLQGELDRKRSKLNVPASHVSPPRFSCITLAVNPTFSVCDPFTRATISL